MVNSFRVCALVSVLGVLGLTAINCREPTQMRVVLRSNAPADNPRVGGFVALDPAAAEKLRTTGAFNFVQEGCKGRTDRCEFGDIYLTPPDEKKGAVLVVVALGGTSLESCIKDPSQKECITARRRFNYVSRETLELVIDLNVECGGKACEKDFETCQANGQCGRADVVCANGNCTLSGEQSASSSGASGNGTTSSGGSTATTSSSGGVATSGSSSGSSSGSIGTTSGSVETTSSSSGGTTSGMASSTSGMASSTSGMASGSSGGTTSGTTSSTSGGTSGMTSSSGSSSSVRPLIVVPLTH
jgi:hypothetical protein